MSRPVSDVVAFPCQLTNSYDLDQSGVIVQPPSFQQPLGPHHRSLSPQADSAGNTEQARHFQSASTRLLSTDVPTREPSPDIRPLGSRTLDIAHFAYIGSRRAISSRASSIVPSRATPALEPPKPAKKTRAITDTLANFSESDLDKLRKCVCCELAWTTRKTVAQKLKHIRTCAKKHLFTEETLQHLLRAEINRVKQLPPEEGAQKRKGKQLEALPEPIVPGTLLEVAIDGGARKKSGRRPQVMESVKELQETRQDILDRARHLLYGSVKVQEQKRNAGDGMDYADFSPPRTQPFGESRLAQQYVPTTMLDQTQIPIDVPEIPAPGPSRRSRYSDEGITRGSPPCTQPFGESALAKKFGKTRAHESSPLREEHNSTAIPRSPPSAIRHIFNEVSNSPPQHSANLPMGNSDNGVADGPTYSQHHSPVSIPPLQGPRALLTLVDSPFFTIETAQFK